MAGKYRVELTYEKGNVTFEMTKDEIEVHFPKEIAILEKSPCSAVSVPDQHGGIFIEKVKG
jgi:hypothetical protein